MKFLTMLTLMASFSQAFAAREFGGISFYSNVEEKQVDILKNDLRYLYTTPVPEADKEFLSTANMQVGDGKNMHNWLINRVGHILGESFELKESNLAIGILQSVTFKYPKTPLPPILLQDDGGEEETPEPEESPEEEKKVRTVMSNIGGAVYLMGKMANIVLGIKIDGEKIYVMSPRTGVLQVGEGLFYEGYLINKDPKAPVNSVSRLGTLFHEARHSDGNGISTGFLHDICPEGHDYAGYAACEASGNGPYTIGALSERHLTRSCTACSTEEKTIMNAVIADSFSRIVNPLYAQKKISLEAEIQSLNNIIATYEDLSASDFPDLAGRIEVELNKLKEKKGILIQELQTLLNNPEARPAPRDATPEGRFDNIDLKKSVRLMEKSLKK